MLGIDFVAVHRIERLAVRDWYTTFWLRPEELSRLSTRPNVGESMAAAIAAKEAVMKASGRGFRQGVRPTEVMLGWSQSGAPSARFDGRRYMVSVTHSDGYAAAVAIDMGGNA